MESINGVTFEDWGAACGNLAAGMTEEEIIKVLGIELPVWQQTNEAWTNKLGDLMAEDMNIATKYSGFFTNPKVGKFAGVASNIPDLESLLKNVPNFDAYQKIFIQQSIAAQHGIDPVSIIEEHGFNHQTWSQVGMHYMNWHNEYMKYTGTEEDNIRFQETSAIRNKWTNYWNEFYKENAANLGEDIDF
jgi:triacylglycerol lipase|uniref:DUF6620 family protein n=1 Tax=Flavobacterium sp. TaxID=239 RepID=UPI0040495182|tara:strand:- start:2247 stop:2813 length:567 start_codon:yes stop_codon:yes gene_type:complete